MKTFRLLGNLGIASCLVMSMCVTLSSCSDDEEDEPQPVGTGQQGGSEEDDIVLDVTSAGLNYGENGAWSSVYDTETGNFNVQDFSFSHLATASEWDGYVYYAWKGFCPTVSVDNADHSDGYWTDYQWGAITGGGYDGAGKAYVLGMWDVYESLETLPDVPSCAISYKSGAVFDPEEIYVTNSAWGYYGMKNGSAYNKAFGEGDWCKLYIRGSKDGVITGTVEVSLAQGTDILNTWKRVDLEALGDVDMVYFQMASSDTGQWGMNNPAYFCLDRLVIDGE